MSNRTRSAEHHEWRPPRVLFLGMRCAFSVPPLRALIEAGYDIPAVVVPGARDGWARAPAGTPLPMAESDAGPALDRVAAAAGIPVLTLGGLRTPEQQALLAEPRPDAIAVACFPWKVPAAIRALPPLGCLNVHPSLLPRWRGPEPLFWTFKRGDATAGVTVHLMDDGLDTGPILLQLALPVPELVDGAAFERTLAEAGGRLLVDALAGLATGTIAPVPRDDAAATRAPSPSDDDLIERTDRPASVIANVVAGIAPLWGPVVVESHLTGERIPVRRVLRVSPDGTTRRPVERAGETVTFRCAPGTVTFARDSSGRLPD